MQLIEVVERFLEAAGWPFERDAGAPLLYLHYVSNEVGAEGGAAADWPCMAFVQEEPRRIAFFSRLPLALPLQRRAAVAQQITRLNYGLAVGNFELDLDDGDLRFKSSLDLGAAELTEAQLQALLEPLIWLNVSTMERHFAALVEESKV